MESELAGLWLDCGWRNGKLGNRRSQHRTWGGFWQNGLKLSQPTNTRSCSWISGFAGERLSRSAWKPICNRSPSFAMILKACWNWSSVSFNRVLLATRSSVSTNTPSGSLIWVKPFAAGYSKSSQIAKRLIH